MYRLPIVKTQNAEPWKIALEERQSDFLAAAENGCPVVVIVSDMQDPATFRYRGYNIYQLFKNQQDLRVAYMFADEIESLLPYLSKIAAVVVSRSLWTAGLQSFINALKHAAVPYIYDIDDLVFDVQHTLLLTNSININMQDTAVCENWFQKIARADIMAGQANGFTSTNHFLAQMLESKYQKPSRVVPNFFNKQQLQVSDTLLRAKQRQSCRKPFTIGYFSGSPSHIKDFEQAVPELVALMEEFKDIRLNVAGHMGFHQPQLKQYLLQGRIQRLPYVNFLQLQRFVAEVDVNIVPLKLNTFTNCKSELKYFEAALVETPTLASPSVTFAGAITNGENGFLCGQGQWYQTIKDIYTGAQGAQAVAKNARQHALAVYGAQNMRQVVRQSYEFFIR